MAEMNVRVLRFVSFSHFRRFSPVVKNHLKRVYLTLICALVASAFGVYIHMILNIGGFFTNLGLIGTMSWLHNTHTYQQSTKRLCVLFLSTLLKGASIGPMIKLAIDLDSSILSTAFVGTVVTFACFSCVAMLARRREYLYLGGLLTSKLFVLGRIQFATLINTGYISAFVFDLEICFGLLLFVGYMLVDTQKLVEKAHRGNRDYVENSFNSFTNFVAVFTRILIILMLKNSAHKVDKHSMALVTRYVCQLTKTAIYEMLVARARRGIENKTKQQMKKRRRNLNHAPKHVHNT